jgi:hypothetical protein
MLTSSWEPFWLVPRQVGLLVGVSLAKSNVGRDLSE